MRDTATRLRRITAWLAKALPLLAIVLLAGVALPDTFGPEEADEPSSD